MVTNRYRNKILKIILFVIVAQQATQTNVVFEHKNIFSASRDIFIMFISMNNYINGRLNLSHVSRISGIPEM